MPGGGLPYVEGVLSSYDAVCTVGEPPFMPMMAVSPTAEWFSCDGGYTRVEDHIVEIWQQYLYDTDSVLVAAEEEQFLGIPIACCSGVEVPMVIQGTMPELTGCVPMGAPPSDTGATADTAAPTVEPPVVVTADTGAPSADRGCGCGGVAPSWIGLPLLVVVLRRRPDWLGRVSEEGPNLFGRDARLALAAGSPDTPPRGTNERLTAFNARVSREATAQRNEGLWARLPHPSWNVRAAGGGRGCP